jgi:hypothetical protein
MRIALWFAIAACVVTGMFCQTVDAGTREDPDLAEGLLQGVGEVVGQGAFPNPTCRGGYFPVGPRLCMSGPFAADTLTNAMAVCQAVFGRVTEYGDWRYRRLFGDGGVAPVGIWLGHLTADNRGLFVNSSDTGDFEAETSRFEVRSYICAHDDDA